MPRLYGAMFGAFVTILLWPATNAPAQTHWVGSWATAQQLPEPRNSLATEDLRDATLRQIVHLSIGGSEIRLSLSNRFSHAPLRFSSVHVAKPVAANSPKILPGTDKAITFSGKPDVTIPAGADYVSDPLPFPVAALSDLAITLHIDQAPSEQTGHPGSRATSYLVHGDSTAAAELEGAKTVEHWYFISGVDVESRSTAASIVTLGDSITDGHGATTDANNRWPDVLAKRLQGSRATQSLGVLNEGIGGNRLLLDGLGPNALARFDHDVLAQAGVRYLIILEGVNDLGTLVREAEVPPAQHEALVRRVLAAYEQIVSRAHAHNIQVFGGTILPYTGSDYYHPGPSSEADRQTINAWIRAPGHFDAVIDFDKITRDPQHPEQMLAAFDSGDHLHPSPAGYAAMAEAIPPSLFGPADRHPASAQNHDDSSAPVQLTAEQDHQRLMDLLHINALRPGVDGSRPDAPNAANYDESKVNPFPKLPDPLLLKNGKKVTTADVWWKKRRPEIVEAFDREIYVRVPRTTPKVKCEVTGTVREISGDVPILTKKLVGHVDNSSYPFVTVDIQLSLTTPAYATGTVPVIMEFGLNPEVLAALARRAAANQSGGANPPNAAGPSWQQQVLAHGWGYATIIPTSVQADNGAGLNQGIIVLCNKGRPRKLDDWGALRAWAWGASRALDYFETDKSVDAKRVGLEGHSRYGKATLVAMATIRALLLPLSALPAKAGPSCLGAIGARSSKTSQEPANITGWPVTS